MIRGIQFAIGIALLIIVEIMRVYFIMPFPGSQEDETLALAYFIHNNIFYIRIIGLLMILFPVIHYFRSGKLFAKIIVSVCLVLYGVVFYMFNFKFLADKMFLQPEHLVFADASKNKVNQKNLVIGVSMDGKSKAYPIEIIGYHHQVRDTIGGKPLMITYCTVCRTGRVYSPIVDQQVQTFRLVGMDHFNAMFEDERTGTWWRQVSGEAVAGPLKGWQLPEVPSNQMSLAAWLDLHPDSFIMQPDSVFKEEYEGLKNYDEGKGKSHLTKADSLSWKPKSWVVGVQIGMHARAYDWKELQQQHIINDTLQHQPILVALAPDSISFHVWERDSLTFRYNPISSQLEDDQTHGTWNWKGECTQGPLQGKRLRIVQAYQEFWHSWKTFHPQTSQYKITQ
jgi:hypothetical protein